MTALPLTETLLDRVDDEWTHLEGRLQERFSHLDPRMVGAVVRAAHQEFAGARIRAYVHILVEREATERLLAQHRADVPAPRLAL